MKYILLAALSAVAFGQNSESNRSVSDDADRLAKLFEKAGGPVRSAASQAHTDNDKNNNGNGSPILLQQVILRPVQWTLTRAVCPLLNGDLTGSGNGRTTISLARNDDGTFNYKTNDEVSGTATDKNNRHYIFFYTQNLYVDSGSGFIKTSPFLFPGPRPPYDVHGTDVFQLIPVDGGTAYTTNAHFKARFNADGTLTDQGGVFGPNISCDPI
ncbi:MAG: hypothetical protein QOH67_4439 [Hyphomicrobiales bacterium]|nr:hypothetical protein [Hyphomicrobiales bacterium]